MGQHTPYSVRAAQSYKKDKQTNKQRRGDIRYLNNLLVNQSQDFYLRIIFGVKAKKHGWVMGNPWIYWTFFTTRCLESHDVPSVPTSFTLLLQSPLDLRLMQVTLHFLFCLPLSMSLCIVLFYQCPLSA